MKTRHRLPRTAPARARAHALHPVCLASLLALSGQAMALPQGAVVSGGKVTVTAPSAKAKPAEILMLPASGEGAEPPAAAGAPPPASLGLSVGFGASGTEAASHKP